MKGVGGVIEAKIQTVEEIYGLVWAAVANRRPIGASYHGFARGFARTGWVGTKTANSVCCAISTAEKRERTAGGRFTGQVALHCAGEAQASEFGAG
jgi:hypothetical protein